MKRVVLTILFLLAVLTLCPTSTMAQQSAAFQYAVKFVCGKSPGRVVAPGLYFTAINVHNPTEKPIRFQKKIAIALPFEKSVKPTKFFDAKLDRDEALEIDCPDILRHLEARPSFVKGFVVIESESELDVVAVYTAGVERVETLHTERVPARHMRTGLPDLVPVPDPQVGFCKRVKEGPDAGKLIVTVGNQGNADAPASTTLVEFSVGGSVSLPTSPVPAGGSVDLPPISIPGVCFHPDCNFKIIVDLNNQVNESNELNNVATGVCLG